jgi:hypothetical protein
LDEGVFEAIMKDDILDCRKILETIDLLNLRIAERFPDASLADLGRHLYEIGKETDEIVQWIEKPNNWYRLLVFIIIFLVIVSLFYTISTLEIDFREFTLSHFVQIADSSLNTIFFLGGAVIFIVSVETRAKRKKVIAAINRIRAIIHIIDAHQLTKDPATIAQEDKATKSSPQRKMTRYELTRYLDYCSEMLSLACKIGFLYVQRFNDPVSIKAVNELEVLSGGISNKIWQKIQITRGKKVFKLSDRVFEKLVRLSQSD